MSANKSNISKFINYTGNNIKKNNKYDSDVQKYHVMFAF